MLTIGICEDNPTELRQLQDMVSHILFDREDVYFKLYKDSREVLSAMDQGDMNCNLLLLDIHMPQPDGMTLAHELRRRQADIDIIFVTNSQEHIFEGYTCKAFAYILKPVAKDRLEEELFRYIDELEHTSECLNVTSHGTKRRVALNAILYMESAGRKIILHTKQGEIEFYEKLTVMEELLKDKGFVRCHQSYLVQLRYVTGISRTGIYMDDLVIPISRKYYESLKDTI